MTTTPHSVSGALPMQVERLRAKIEAEARRYAAMYPEASDGRNTFVIFADYVAALAKPEGGTVTDDGVWKADAEVERILSLSDDQVLAEASPEDLAWARLFKARMIAIKHALPGRYDGVSTHAAIRGDADNAPYMLAIREALAAFPKLTTGASSEEVGLGRVIAEARKNLALTQGCLDCNADDERRWVDTIEWLEGLA